MDIYFGGDINQGGSWLRILLPFEHWLFPQCKTYFRHNVIAISHSYNKRLAEIGVYHIYKKIFFFRNLIAFKHECIERDNAIARFITWFCCLNHYVSSMMYIGIGEVIDAHRLSEIRLTQSDVWIRLNLYRGY